MEQYLRCYGGPRGGKWSNESASATRGRVLHGLLCARLARLVDHTVELQQQLSTTMGCNVDNMGIVKLRVVEYVVTVSQRCF